MKQPYRHRVNERGFLNLPGFHEGAYVIAYVEDTSERGLEPFERTGDSHNPHPRMLLQIADCEGHISLDFDISSTHQRANSFTSSRRSSTRSRRSRRRWLRSPCSTSGARVSTRSRSPGMDA